MVWPFRKKKKEEKVEEKKGEKIKTEKIDDEKAMQILQKELGIDPNTLQTALQRVQELSKNKVCIICGQPIKEGEKYEEIDFLGSKLYMHEKCKKKFQKQILKLMRSGQLNKVLEMYTKMLKQGLPNTTYTFQAFMNTQQNDINRNG